MSYPVVEAAACVHTPQKIIITREIYIVPQNAEANSEAQVIAHRKNA